MTDKLQADIDLAILVRNIQWRYRLDQYEGETITNMLRDVQGAVSDIKKSIFMGDGAPHNAEDLIAELETLSVALRNQIASHVADMSSAALEYSAGEHQRILSFDGIVNVGNPSLSADQFKAFLAGPVGGGTSLPEWVDAAWGNTVSDQIRRSLNIGVLKGESYQKMVGSLLDSSIADFTQREAVTIARTYVQTANVAAQMAVYQQNDDLVTGWTWCATLENGYKSTGRGTCLACAVLDGRSFKLGEGPSIPLHPRCRCFARPALKPWRELGVNRKELETALRPYIIRPDENIDAGGARQILESGKHQGDYGTWIEKQNNEFKLQVLGPKRFELFRSGQVRWNDLVDESGNVRTLEELHGLKSGKTA